MCCTASFFYIQYLTANYKSKWDPARSQKLNELERKWLLRTIDYEVQSAPSLFTLTSPDPGRPTLDLISQPMLRWLTIRADDPLDRKPFFHKQLSRASTQTLRWMLISSLQTLRRMIVAVKALLCSYYDATDSWDFERLITQTSQAAINGFVSALIWSLIRFLSSTLQG